MLYFNFYCQLDYNLLSLARSDISALTAFLCLSYVTFSSSYFNCTASILYMLSTPEIKR